MLQLTFVNFKQNSYIQVEGTPATSCFYIIQSGKIRCFHETEVPGNAPRMLGPGDFIGVVACMSSHSQTESVIAITNVVAIMLSFIDNVSILNDLNTIYGIIYNTIK